MKPKSQIYKGRTQKIIDTYGVATYAKIPEYIEECKRLNIEILKPDINKSYTKLHI